MKQLRVNLSDFFDREPITVLHDTSSRLFQLYALYEAIDSWINSILNIPYTIIGGAIDGLFTNTESIKTIKEINLLRRRGNREGISNDIMNLIKAFQSHQFYDHGVQNGIKPDEFRTMITNGNFARLKNLINSDTPQGGEQLVSDANHRQLASITHVEQYPLSIRKLLANNIELITSNPGSIANFKRSSTTLLKDEENLKLLRKIEELIHGKVSLDPNEVIENTILDLAQIDKKTFDSPEDFEKYVFALGKQIGKTFKKFTEDDQNDLRTSIELSALIIVYSILYLLKTAKSLLVQPIDILKCIMIGFIHGIDQDLLQENNLDMLLIDPKHPINEFTFACRRNYEALAAGYDNFDYASGKKCPMKVIERLISTKTEYLVNGLRNPEFKNMKEVMKNNKEIEADIGQQISRDNPAAHLFSILNTLHEFIQRLSFTAGHYVGGGCKSFYEYVSSSANNQPVLAVQ